MNWRASSGYRDPMNHPDNYPTGSQYREYNYQASGASSRMLHEDLSYIDHINDLSAACPQQGRSVQDKNSHGHFKRNRQRFKKYACDESKLQEGKLQENADVLINSSDGQDQKSKHSHKVQRQIPEQSNGYMEHGNSGKDNMNGLTDGHNSDICKKDKEGTEYSDKENLTRDSFSRSGAKWPRGKEKNWSKSQYNNNTSMRWNRNGSEHDFHRQDIGRIRHENFAVSHEEEIRKGGFKGKNSIQEEQNSSCGQCEEDGVKEGSAQSSLDGQGLGARAKSDTWKEANKQSAQDVEKQHLGNYVECELGSRDAWRRARTGIDRLNSKDGSLGIGLEAHDVLDEESYMGVEQGRRIKTGRHDDRRGSAKNRNNGESQAKDKYANYQYREDNSRKGFNGWEKKRLQGRNQQRDNGNRSLGNRGQNWRDKDMPFTSTCDGMKKDEQRANDAYIDVCNEEEDGKKLQQSNFEMPKKTDEKQIGKSSNSETVEFAEISDHSNRQSANGRRKNSTLEASKWQDETQRGLLIEQLFAGKYECLVCCNVIRRDAAIWSCSNCYHIYHMYCIKKWAQSPAAASAPEAPGNAWRCPTCQNPYLQVPNQYTCFCGKQKDPEFSRYSTPHSCNETCGRERSRGCPHLCNLLCHPGPCPPCTAFVTRSCDCGKTKRSLRCAGVATSFKCSEPCHRALNCGQHECEAFCHAGSCDPCTVTIERKCYCGQETEIAQCGSAKLFLPGFSCGRVCSRELSCGLHTCGDKCHPGPCAVCPRTPSEMTLCPCGKTNLADIKGAKPRKTCEDPVATCDKLCDKELSCGNEGSHHQCKETCHEGLCSAKCRGTTEVTCQCGALTKAMACLEFRQMTGSASFLCDRRCKKKMSCGRHKCNQQCCISTEHRCQLICGYKLSCGLHRCEEPCHRGNCPSCWQVSFEELRCYCGAEVMYPPVPCGAKPPACHRPCTRQHACSHQPTHNCHSEDLCPPCTVLTEKWCMGHHELRRNIPCYVTEISCGMQCGKELPCVIHRCLQPCHKGSCLDGQVCTQPCPIIREECGHLCQAPCHPGLSCPATVCKAEITLQCECGRRKEKGQCLCGHGPGTQNDYSKMTAQLVASKLWEGQSIDLSVLTKAISTNKKTRKLQCNSECAIMERNQRLALALEIKNPDISSKLGSPPYSQFLKDFAKQNPAFVANVEKALSSLVTAAQQPKAVKKSHAFKVMPSNQRRVVHELAEFYGCQTESYDEEPNKNVVATAVRDKCWLPSVTLTALIQKELCPKAPIPIPINCKEEQIRSAAQAARQSTEVFTFPSAAGKALGGGNSSGRRQNAAQIDYFDVTD